jgi:hypothetical protein
MMHARRFLPVLAILVGVTTADLDAQCESATIEITPASLSLEAGEEALPQTRVLEGQVNEIDAPVMFFPLFQGDRPGGARRSLGVSRSEGTVSAVKGGFAEYFSGLWAVRLAPRDRLVP